MRILPMTTTNHCVGVKTDTWKNLLNPGRTMVIIKRTKGNWNRHIEQAILEETNLEDGLVN